MLKKSSDEEVCCTRWDNI